MTFRTWNKNMKLNRNMWNMNVKKTKSDVSINCLYSLGYRFILYYISVDTSVLRRGAALAPVFGFAATATAHWRRQCSFSLSSLVVCNILFAGTATEKLFLLLWCVPHLIACYCEQPAAFLPSRDEKEERGPASRSNVRSIMNKSFILNDFFLLKSL